MSSLHFSRFLYRTSKNQKTALLNDLQGQLGVMSYRMAISRNRYGEGMLVKLSDKQYRGELQEILKEQNLIEEKIERFKKYSPSIVLIRSA